MLASPVIRPSLGLILAVLFVTTGAFNVDTKNAVIHHMANSYFGYSIDFFNEQKGMPVLVVGAPNGGSSNPKLAGVAKPGAVYSCSVNRATCREVHVDKKGIDRRLNGSVSVPIDDKSHQFFGATIRSNDKHDKLLMCAPQYKYFFSKFDVIEPVGNCFYAQNGFDNTEEFSSCKQEPARHGRHRFGYGQCGFSAAIAGKKGLDRAFIGAPGVWYWQGAIFSQSTKNFTGDRPNTEYSSKEYDHDMMGYATAVGDFDGDGLDDVVTGVPRGYEIYGKLVLYTSKLQTIRNLTAEDGQHGEYCGGSLAVADVDKNGLDDIIMGCPFYTDYRSVKDAKTQEHKPQYDVGRIVVFLQTAHGVFSKGISIVGEDQWGRFGFSLASAGDLNLDGYNDIVVGAPYAGKNKQGAVYIVHGSKDGVRSKPTQKIEATSLAGGNAKTFGFSVAGGVDVDGNGMPDIAVGAWKSGNAAVLMTKPVVTVTGSTEVKPTLINLEEKDCDVGDAKLGKQTCRTIKTCLQYQGKGDTPNDLEFDLHINLDDHSPEPRAYFLRKDLNADRNIKVAAGSKTRDHPSSIEHRVRLSKNRQNCFMHKFFASSTMRDKLSPIHYSVNYTMIESKTGRVRGDKLEPAIDTTVPLSYEGKVNIANNCGKDDLCVPDLKVVAIADRQKFLLGTEDNTVQINVTVQNGGEDSYETKLFFDVPRGFEYSGIETLAGPKTAAKSATSAPTCSPTTKEPDADGKWTFGCDLGNPLPANQVVSSVVKITASSENPPLETIHINAHVNSSNPEEASTIGDNKISFTIPVDIQNQLNLAGMTRPDQVDFSIKNMSKPEIFDDDEIGPVVSHVFEVRNRGPSEIDGATLDIFWPSFSADGNPLLYIITEPYIDKVDKARCRVKQPQNINSMNLRITNTHLPTEEPRATVQYPKEAEDDESYEASKEASEVNGEGDGIGESHFQYVANPQPEKDYEYIPNEENNDYEAEYEDDENKKKVKRSPKKKASKAASVGRNEATFSDLRQAVQLSKEADGMAEYKGKVSRATVDCHQLRCTHIECDIQHLKADENVIVEVFSRLYVDTMIREKNMGGDISSLAVAKVTSTKYKLAHKPTLITAVTTMANAIDTDGEGRDLPWWLYLIAVLIGLAILILLILLLWRCGFFKRNRPPTEQAELKAQRGQEQYADSSARYASQDTYNPRSHGQML